ncbi:MAG: nitroreductase family protein [Anaerolineaceae bacterium]|nr:nitroreductase family protein [Anaerolineaceae bacterium]
MFADNKLDTLNNIIRARHTTRKFKTEAPEKAIIGQVVEAGLYAPYAAMTGMKLEELRHIVVLAPESDVCNKVKDLLYAEIKNGYRKLSLASRFSSKLRRQGQTFIKRLAYFVEKGVPALDQGTYWILVLEKKGIPSSSNLAVAHVLENMWLEATALGLGFQLLSATKLLEKSTGFWETIGYEKGLYELDGCLAGYSDQVGGVLNTLAAADYVQWL